MYDIPPADELFWPAAAAQMAAILSKTPCDRELFMSLAIQYCLPVYAIPARRVNVKCRSSLEGRRYVEPVVEPRAFYVLLLPNELYQLENGGGPVYATQAVPGYEDPLHIDWSIVKRFRDLEFRADHVNVAFNHGRWMGQAADMFLAEPALIRDNTNFQIPRHTIDEVVSLLYAKASEERLVGGEDNVPDEAKIPHESRHEQPFTNRSMVASVRGITKHQVLEVFRPFIGFNLEKALGNGKGLYGPNGARVQKGSMGRHQRHIGLWNPVILAIGLYEKGDVPLHKLKLAFRTHDCLAEWGEEFAEQFKDLL